jgi:hypothetical protein
MTNPKKGIIMRYFLINLYELQPLKIIPTVTIDGAIVTNSIPSVFTYYHIIGAIGLTSSYLFLLLSDKIKKNGSIFYTTFQRVRTILFISYFLYFVIVRKSIRTFTTKMTVSKVTRKFHLVAAKKGSLIIVIMDI